MAPQQGGDARLQLGAEVAPPTENGELVFEAPWEARVFALAHHLCDAGLYSWDDFREALIAEIAQWDAAHRREKATSTTSVFRRRLRSCW